MTLSESGDRHDVEMCQEIGRQARAFYPGKTWESVEPLARRVWESQDTSTAWAEAEPLVKSVWREPEA